MTPEEARDLPLCEYLALTPEQRAEVRRLVGPRRLVLVGEAGPEAIVPLSRRRPEDPDA